MWTIILGSNITLNIGNNLLHKEKNNYFSLYNWIEFVVSISPVGS